MALRFVERAAEADDFPLTIRHLLDTWLVTSTDLKIVYRDDVRIAYRTLRECLGRLANALSSLDAVSAARFTIGRVATLVVDDAIQMHAGIGMTWKLPLPHYAKRLTMIDHQLGDADYHLDRDIRLGATAGAEAA